MIYRMNSPITKDSMRNPTTKLIVRCLDFSRSAILSGDVPESAPHFMQRIG